MREYKSRSGETLYKPSVEQLHELEDDSEGWCLACGNTQPAESDATKYTCEACGKPKVYGAGELMLMNLYY